MLAAGYFRISFPLSAIVLIIAMTAQPVFAQEARSSGAREGPPRHHSDEDATGNGAKHEGVTPKDSGKTDTGGQRLPQEPKGTMAPDGKTPDGKTPGGKTPDGKASDGKTSDGKASDGKASDGKAADGKTSDGVDTRFGVLPRRLNNNRQINAKTELPPGKNFQRRLSQPPDALRPVVRNSIGLPIPSHDSGERERAHADTPGVPHNTGLGTPGVTGNQADRFSKAEGHFDRLTPNTNPIVKPVVPNRAAINGTGMAHRGFGPSQIGGPAATAGRISGTTIKPKH
jgi:hypothetical protein